jgi:hypothetical protein
MRGHLPGDRVALVDPLPAAWGGRSGRSAQRPPTPVPGERPAWSSTESWDYGVGSGSARPGDLVHVDIKKLGRIPSGGGHRARGRRTGIPPRPRDRLRLPHVAVDDHSRLAYVELLADEHDHGCADF